MQVSKSQWARSILAKKRGKEKIFRIRSFTSHLAHTIHACLFPFALHELSLDFWSNSGLYTYEHTHTHSRTGRKYIVVQYVLTRAWRGQRATLSSSILHHDHRSHKYHNDDYYTTTTATTTTKTVGASTETTTSETHEYFVGHIEVHIWRKKPLGYILAEVNPNQFR